MIQLHKINCRQCGQERWDDGLRCACGAYENRFLKDDGYGHMIDVRLRKEAPVGDGIIVRGKR